MTDIPRFVSYVALALGGYDMARAVAHTVFAAYAAADVAGLDLTGPTGRDQIVLMVAFGASNVITGAALILLGLIHRLGALILLSVIPAAYLLAHIGLLRAEAGLVGQGVFPGADIMRVYVAICALTVIGALLMRWRARVAADAVGREPS